MLSARSIGPVAEADVVVRRPVVCEVVREAMVERPVVVRPRPVGYRYGYGPGYDPYEQRRERREG